MLDAQAEQATLVQTIRDLEAKIASFEAWDAEKNKYELKEIGAGSLAYMRKPDARAGQPPHWLCTQCYQNRKPSIMQLLGGFDDYSVYINAQSVPTPSRMMDNLQNGLIETRGLLRSLDDMDKRQRPRLLLGLAEVAAGLASGRAGFVLLSSSPRILYHGYVANTRRNPRSACSS